MFAMMIRSLIASETQVRDAAATLADIDHALASEQALAAIVKGLPAEVINGVRKALTTERREIQRLIDAYERAKVGDIELMRKNAGHDPGAALIVARLAQGLTQKELARKLGLREQAVQRYEVEKYRGISLFNYLKFASVLGVEWRIGYGPGLRDGWALAKDISPAEARKVLKHARDHKWFDEAEPNSDEDGLDQLKR
ncbi:MAG: helix-turn-helix transcriptional regulator, partial [Pseudomonadota bacterium]